MENIREYIYLAALLHDIGKLYQRADTGTIMSSKYLDQKIKNLESTILPSQDRGIAHEHAIWTAQFIYENEIIFSKLLGADFTNLSDKDGLILLSSSNILNNSNQTNLGKIITEAISLSSGSDKESEANLGDVIDGQRSSFNNYKNQRMVSVLETIGMNKKDISSKKEWRHLPLEPMTLSKTFFPSKEQIGEPDYKSIWNKFNRDFKFIQSTSYLSFSETLLNLLFKYTSNVPTDTVNLSDTSLYDHLKTTSALAVCLYDHYQEDNKSENPFILIGADFSGIQSYIYQIVSKHASKNLKGRSFYLKLLSDAAVNYIIKELNLFQSNIIYNSGGSFYIIAPNTSFVRNKMQEITLNIEKNIFESHGSTLFLSIDYVEISKDALLYKNNKNLNDCWSSLFSKRDEKKQHKLHSIVSNDYESFFLPTSFGIEIDSITGEGIINGEKIKNITNIGKVKYNTYKQIELGKNLRESEILLMSHERINSLNDKNPLQPASLGVYFYLLKKKDLVDIKDQLKILGDKVTIITMNGKDGDCDFMYAGDTGSLIIHGLNNIYGLEFYGGNIFDGKTFDEFCNKENSEMYRRLGVLRMDVDNLGHIFQSGIVPERATLSRFAALSRSFDYFFSGYLNTIKQEMSAKKSFIVYSGGDDLFIVGSWEDSIKLAHQIKKDFNEFTCYNPVFSLSGGIAIVPPKYPIMRASKDSEVEEQNAKRHICGGETKNSISFMNVPLNWTKEYPIVEMLKNKLVELIKEDKLPKSFIGKVLQHRESANIKNSKIKNLKTFWMIPYDLGRMISRNTSNEVRTVIDNCKNEVCTNRNTLNGEIIETNYHSLELWALASRWAELEIRTYKN